MKTKKSSLPQSIFSKFTERQCLSLEPITDSEKELSKESIDTIANFPKKDYLSVVALKSDNFEYLAETYGKQFRRLTLWHCPRIKNLKPLEKFVNLEVLDADWNQLTESFWNFQKTPKIVGINLCGFNKIKSLKPLSTCKTLQEFSFTMGINNNKSVIESLKPLAGLPELWDLEIRADKIEDMDITPLANIPKLRKLGMPTNIFDIASYAWLKNKISNKVECDIFDKDEDQINISILKGSGEEVTTYSYKLILGIGQRKGKRYFEDWTRAVDWFSKNPKALPKDYQNIQK